MRLVLRRMAAIVVALSLLTAFSVGTAGAQGQTGTNAPGVWQSAINLQNVGAAAATPVIAFYNASGAVVTTFTPSAPIAAGGSLSIFVPTQVASLTAGQFSAVVSSTEPFQVSVNTSSTNSATAPWTSFAYEGASQGGTTLFFPGLYKNYFGFSSEMVVQNAGTTAATLKADFYNAAGTKIATASLGSLNANASKTFGIASLATTPALPSGNSLGIFGAVVTSSQNAPLVGIGNIWRTNGTASYTAATAGAATIYAPSLLNNYFGFSTALTVQNVNPTQSATVKITYSNGVQENFSLGPFAARAFFQPDNKSLPSGNSAGIFSAKVTATGGSIVGLVSQSVPSGAQGSFASYNAVAQAGTSVNIPSVLKDYFGFFTATTVQNTGSTPTNITIKYATGQTKTYNSVPANGTINIIQLNGQTPLSGSVATSAVVSAGNPLVAVIQTNTAPGVVGYNAAKVPSDFLLAVDGAAK